MLESNHHNSLIPCFGKKEAISNLLNWKQQLVWGKDSNKSIAWRVIMEDLTTRKWEGEEYLMSHNRHHSNHLLRKSYPEVLENSPVDRKHQNRLSKNCTKTVSISILQCRDTSDKLTTVTHLTITKYWDVKYLVKLNNKSILIHNI